MRQRMYSENVGGNWGLPAGYMEAATAPGRNIAAGISSFGQSIGNAIEQYQLNKEKHALADGEIGPALQRFLSDGGARAGVVSEGPNEGSGEGSGTGSEGAGEGTGEGGEILWGKAKEVVGSKLLDKYIGGNASLAEKLAIANNIKTYEGRQERERAREDMLKARAEASRLANEQLLFQQNSSDRQHALAGQYYKLASLTGRRQSEAHEQGMKANKFNYDQAIKNAAQADANNTSSSEFMRRLGSGEPLLNIDQGYSSPSPGRQPLDSEYNYKLGGQPPAPGPDVLDRFRSQRTPEARMAYALKTPGLTPDILQQLTPYLKLLADENTPPFDPKFSTSPSGVDWMSTSRNSAIPLTSKSDTEHRSVTVTTGDGTAGSPVVRRDLTAAEWAAEQNANPRAADAETKKWENNLAQLLAAKAAGKTKVDGDQLLGGGGVDTNPLWGAISIDKAIDAVRSRLNPTGAPAAGAMDGVLMPRTKKEFDALPKGARYKNPENGKIYIKN